MSAKISKGEAGSKRSRGLKPLLREKISLDFFDVCGINLLSIQSILRLIKDRQFKLLSNLKNFMRQYTVLSNALFNLDRRR
jgi:hypothetical protein